MVKCGTLKEDTALWAECLRQTFFLALKPKLRVFSFKATMQ